MKQVFTLLCSICFLTSVSFGQVYVDEFDNDAMPHLGGSPTYSFEEANGELSINASNTGPWDVFTYAFHNPDTEELVSVDATGNNKVFVRAKASNVGVSLRMDLQDSEGYVTSLAGITKILTTEYQILEFDFTGLYSDGGFGGTPCTAGPCPVDATDLASVVFFTDPGVGGFSGTVVIDYIAFGEEPDGVIMSDVFQDHFDMDSSINSFVETATYGLTLNGNSELVIAGDGTNPMWDPLTYLIRNPVTYDPIDIDVTGNHKMYIKVKSTVPNTAIRFDLIDIDGFANTQGSITKLIGTDYSVIEFDFAGTYIDLGYGGTPCTPETAPCPVDATRIAQLNIFIEPGVGEFLGEITVDYLSFDIPLEPAGPPAEFLYEDHFNNETLEFTAEDIGFTVVEVESDLVITGDGSAPAYTAISYILHDKDLNEETVLDLGPAQDKVFIRARTETGSVPLRLDLVDTAGYITNQASLTKILSDEFETYEFNFNGNYLDGGFGGTPCETGPCEVDGSAIRQALLYIDPVQGAYDGTVYIDFISIGQPAMDEGGPIGIVNYSDQMADASAAFLSDVDGLVSSIADSEWTITGDGTGPMWTPIVYTPNDEVDPILVNAVGSDDKLFFRAKTSVPGTQLRIDLQDVEGYVSNAASVSFSLTEEYVTYEINYAANYNDGGFGGTPCEAGPCPVDGERITNLQFFFNPGVGGLDGTVTIDWVSFGEPLDGSTGPTGIINYQDEMDANTILFIEDESGFTSTTGDAWTITGDGTANPYAPVVYTIHNDAGEPILADAVGSNDLLYVRARASEDVNLRIDLQDQLGYVTNANAQSVNITSEYEIYELNYAGAYNDGGFGGTPCTAGPCPVDGQRIATIQVFANADDGGYGGVIDIDWLSFGAPLVGVEDHTRLNSLVAFPNPAQDQLNLALETIQAGEVQVVIVNTIGQALFSEQLDFINGGNSTHTLDIMNLPQGVYTLIVMVEGSNAGFLKFVK